MEIKGCIVIVKLTHDQFLEKLYSIRKNVIPKERYINSGTPIMCECVDCGNEWKISPDNLYLNKRCPLCARKSRADKQRKTTDEFIMQMSHIDKNIEVVGEYTRAKAKILCKCIIHGELFYAAPTHLLRGESGCKQCIKIKNHLSGLKTIGEFIDDLSVVNDMIDVIGEYVNAKTPIRVVCKRCGYEWSSEPTTLLSGCGCRNCYQSRGERVIRIWLDRHGLEYEQQKKYDGLVGVGGRKLSYDFYVPSANTLIEYHGQFHDGSVNIESAKRYYDTQKEHDRRKVEYAVGNGINLLCLWYNGMDNYERILEMVLMQNPVEITVV